MLHAGAETFLFCFFDDDMAPWQSIGRAWKLHSLTTDEKNITSTITHLGHCVFYNNSLKRNDHRTMLEASNILTGSTTTTSPESVIRFPFARPDWTSYPVQHNR